MDYDYQIRKWYGKEGPEYYEECPYCGHEDGHHECECGEELEEDECEEQQGFCKTCQRALK